MTRNRLVCCCTPLAPAVLIALLAATPSPAQTMQVGDVEFNEPGFGDITVGYANDGNDFAFGQLFISDMAADPDSVDEQYDRLVVGNEDLTIGEVFLSGAGALVRATDSGLDNPAVVVGERGTGLLVVSGGAQLAVTNTNNGTLEIGEELTGFGEVIIEGRTAANFPTRLVISENLVVGGAGVGEMTVRGGALVNHTEEQDSVLTIGQEASGAGLLVVEGLNTRYLAPEIVDIGVVGVGQLRVGAGATFDSNNDQLEPGETVTVGPRGYVNLQGGRFFTERATVDGRLGGEGLVSGPITVSATGEVSTGPGKKLNFLGSLTNSGVVDIFGTPEQRAEIEFFSTATNNAAGGGALPGRIAVADGIVRFAQGLTNNGTLASAGGDTDFHGDITTAAGGRVAIGGESNATFYDNVTVPGGTLSIAAGSTALFLGDLTISAGSVLAITIDESAEKEGFSAPVQVAGSTFLGSPITVELEDGFVPTEGLEIPLLEAAGGFFIDSLGTQGFADLPGGLSWDVLLTADGLVAQVVATPLLPGDFNGDNLVSAADYTIARDLGRDLTPYRQNFGQPAGGLLEIASSTVPEPSAAGIALMAALLVPGRRRRR